MALEMKVETKDGKPISDWLPVEGPFAADKGMLDRIENYIMAGSGLGDAWGVIQVTFQQKNELGPICHYRIASA